MTCNTGLTYYVSPKKYDAICDNQYKSNTFTDYYFCLSNDEHAINLWNVIIFIFSALLGLFCIAAFIVAQKSIMKMFRKQYNDNACATYSIISGIIIRFIQILLFMAFLNYAMIFYFAVLGPDWKCQFFSHESTQQDQFKDTCCDKIVYNADMCQDDESLVAFFSQSFLAQTWFGLDVFQLYVIKIAIMFIFYEQL